MRVGAAAGLLLLAAACRPAAAQGARPDPAVLDAIRQEALASSRLESLAHVLLDSIGPRLTGTPGLSAAQEWVMGTYQSWGIAARREDYGTWRGWRRGITHVDLLEPRVRTLEATLLAWSDGTPGRITGEVVLLPEGTDSVAFRHWVAAVRGRFVLTSAPPPSCRPEESWATWGSAEAAERVRDEPRSSAVEWARRVMRATQRHPSEFPDALRRAGAAGLLTSEWTGGWGATRIDAAPTRGLPSLVLSCEDYGLLHRLAAHGGTPTIAVQADAQATGEVPVGNVVAEIRGRERPDEYIVLSAHLDSWDGASGATDNGTGTILMMEVLRLLRHAYPSPRRTILVGHWSGEEQGLNGSRAFAEDHPDVVRSLHLLLNQDSGTGRIRSMSMEGFTRLGSILTRWLAAIPDAGADVGIVDPGTPSLFASSDHAAFACAGAPALTLKTAAWDYDRYTWHTNRDTYDKISFDDLRRNAAIVASLVYLADQEPDPLPRDRVQVAADPAGQWRVQASGCTPATRASP